MSLEGMMHDVPMLLKEPCLMCHDSGRYTSCSVLSVEGRCMIYLRLVFWRKAAWCHVCRRNAAWYILFLQRRLHDTSCLLKEHCMMWNVSRRKLHNVSCLLHNAAWCNMSPEGMLYDVSSHFKECCMMFYDSWRKDAWCIMIVQEMLHDVSCFL